MITGKIWNTGISYHKQDFFFILFGNIWPQKSELSVKMKFGILPNLNMQNLMVMFTSAVLD